LTAGTWYINNDITVNSGVTLTISAGANINLTPATTVTVNGTLSIASSATISGGGSIVTAGSGKIVVTNSTDATAFNSSRKLVRDSAGNYHLVFETENEICYEKLTGSGALTQFSRLSAGNGSNKFPSIAERSGKLYVIWQRKIGTNLYNLLFRHFNATSWETIRTVTSSIASSNDLLPVISVSKPSASFGIMVAYRTNSGLASKLSTSTNGSSWPTTEYMITSNTSARNPSLVYRGAVSLTFNVTWDDGSNISHQVFNGSTWEAATTLSDNTASINH